MSPDATAPHFDEIPDFDEIIDRTGTDCSKWDDMQAIYGVDPHNGGLAMWVADMDFRPPQAVRHALQSLVDRGVYGYPGQNRPYLDAIAWWMGHRHGWQIDTDWILTVAGLVNGTSLAIDAFTAPGDGVAIMSPVYHAFARVIRASGRGLTELPLTQQDGQYVMDIDGWQGMLAGHERMLILCSPHNPGGRVWSEQELRQAADFCVRNDLILISDDIHCDLVMPGTARHRMVATVAPDISDRLVTLSAATKTFNIAGAHLGNAIVADPHLRARMQAAIVARGISPSLFGLDMVAAAYSPAGAAWVDALMPYLDGNRRVIDAALNAIPGVRSMPLQATYLTWADFGDTGMTPAEFTARVQTDARIAASHGHSFGPGGAAFLRFNIAMPRARVRDAADRLTAAFADLQ